MSTTGKHHPLYDTWRNLKDRILDDSHQSFHNYGAMGIKIWQPWVDPREGFMRFIGDLGYRRACRHTTLDRIDPEGHYTPWNTRWANRSVQSQNKIINKVFIHEGVKRTLGEIIAIECLDYKKHIKEFRTFDYTRVADILRFNFSIFVEEKKIILVSFLERRLNEDLRNF